MRPGRVTTTHSLPMDIVGQVGRISYAGALAGLGIQQVAYGQFLPALFPTWPAHLPGLSLWAGLVGGLLLTAGAAIMLNRKAGLLSLVVGGLLLGLVCFGQVPYELLVDPYRDHLGSWTNALTTLALAGGALTLGGFLYEQQPDLNQQAPLPNTIASKASALGRLCFCTTLVAYGLAHFLYTPYISPLVPAWIPYPTFWTQFAGVALLGAGATIALGIHRQTSAILLGTMIGLWVIGLHLPRVLTAPAPAYRGELSSLLEAIAYTGTALVIAASQAGSQRPAPERHGQPTLVG